MMIKPIYLFRHITIESILNKKAIVFASISAAIAVISVMLLISIFSPATKNFGLDVDPIKDNQNLFNTARVTLTNTGKLTLDNVTVIYDNKSTERINSLPPGQKIMLSPPDNFIFNVSDCHCRSWIEGNPSI